MLLFYISFWASSLVILAEASTYHSFVNHGYPKTRKIANSKRKIPDYALEYFVPPDAIWADEDDPPHPIPQIDESNPAFQRYNNGHITPDFTDGLEYPDPLLLTGEEARRAVAYHYSKELFFNDIPHLRALRKNQEMRRHNGLAGHRLGSIRYSSPFYRFSKPAGYY